MVLDLILVYNLEKNILVPGEGLTQGLNDTKITAEANYPTNFTRSGRRFVLSLHYNGSNSFLFVTAMKTYQFKAIDPKIKPYSFGLGNMLIDFTIDNMNKIVLKGYVDGFSVDYNIIDTNDILDS